MLAGRDRGADQHHEMDRCGETPEANESFRPHAFCFALLESSIWESGRLFCSGCRNEGIARLQGKVLRTEDPKG